MVRVRFTAMVLLVGCTASGPTEKPLPLSGTSPPVLPPAPTAALPRPTALTSSAPAPAPVAAEPAHAGPLRQFYDALWHLDKKQRKEHVRVVWLGDSHAQADFWPDAIRRGLQQRFGNGGLGFVHFGMKSYRHAGVKLDIRGGWRMRPKMPSTVDPWGDGAFGLGGILHAGFSGYRAVTLDITDERLNGRKVALDLCYKPGLPADEFALEVGGATAETMKFDKDAVGTIAHLSRTTQAPARVRVRVKNGRPDFCGLVIETDPGDGPGVVLDNLGINGARYATPLAWNEKAWAAEVQRRPPELFIFEYGGNEASDGIVKPKQYQAHAMKLIGRARRAVPEASCLVIGPSDRADAEQRIPPIVNALKAAAADSKCQFWNTYEVMGGRGSISKWRDDERAAPDGVHLTPKGYAEIGALMLQDLMAGYKP